MQINPLITSSSTNSELVEWHKELDLLTINRRHQAVDVRISPYSLLQTSCSLQWQEVVKVLVQPLSDNFQAKVQLERSGYPSQFADFFFFLWKYCKCAMSKQFDLYLRYYCRFVFVHCERRCHLFDMKFILKQQKLTTEMPGNCVYEEYG